MSAGWQWAYRGLKDGIRTMRQTELLLESHPDYKFVREAMEGIAAYVEEVTDEHIAREEKDGNQQAS